jgi:hypothetical protein
VSFEKLIGAISCRLVVKKQAKVRKKRAVDRYLDGMVWFGVIATK